jgi:hemolysin D
MNTAHPIGPDAQGSRHTPRHPVRELLARYRDVFQVAWRARKELAGPQRLADERAFLPAAMALQETPPHPAPRRAAIAICGLFVLALLWAILGRIDIVAVAEGRVVVSNGAKVIQPLEASVVKSIHVKDGDRVQAGQLLIALDATASQADMNRVRQDRSAAWAERLRTQSLLKAMANGGVPILEPHAELEPGTLAAARMQLQSEWADITAKLARLNAEVQRRRAEITTAEQVIAKLRATVPLARQRESDIRSLTEQGFISGHASQDRTRERIELERDLATAQAQRDEAQAALAESEHARTAYRAETERRLRELLAQAELKTQQLGEESSKASMREGLTRLTAPLAGTVQQLSVHTAGGVVTPAQVLLVLVPDEAGVTAEVVLENKDVGFVRPGQFAELKLETFPYTRYGTVKARVSSITADAVRDEKRGAIFPATLLLQDTQIDVDGRRIKLSPGMNLTAEIKTGRRRVIDYLLSPVQRQVDESLRER